MLNRLTYRLLHGIAKTLVRYANSIEAFLAKKSPPNPHKILNRSDEGPPAHWLEKVRQGAPHLLDDINRSNSPIPHSFDKNAEDSPFVASHINAQADSSTKQQTFAEQPTALKQETEKMRKWIRPLSIQAVAKNILGKVKQMLDTFNHTKTHPSERRKTEAKKQTKRHIAKFDDSALSSHAPSSVSSLGASKSGETLISGSGHSKLSSSMQKTSAPSDRKSSEAGPVSDMDQKLVLQCRRREEKKQQSSVKSVTKNQPVIHLSPPHTPSTKLKRKLKPSPEKPTTETRKVASTGTSADKEDNRNGLNQIFQTKKERIDHVPVSPLSKKMTSVFDFAGSDIKQRIVKNNVSNVFPESVSKNRKSFSVYKTNQFQSDSFRWPDMPNETDFKADPGRWPELPEEDWMKQEETPRESMNFQHLREIMKREFLSEQEQRGKLWSG